MEEAPPVTGRFLFHSRIIVLCVIHGGAFDKNHQLIWGNKVKCSFILAGDSNAVKHVKWNLIESVGECFWRRWCEWQGAGVCFYTRYIPVSGTSCWTLTFSAKSADCIFVSTVFPHSLLSFLHFLKITQSSCYIHVSVMCCFASEMLNNAFF